MLEWFKKTVTTFQTSLEDQGAVALEVDRRLLAFKKPTEEEQQAFETLLNLENRGALSSLTSRIEELQNRPGEKCQLSKLREDQVELKKLREDLKTHQLAQERYDVQIRHLENMHQVIAQVKTNVEELRSVVIDAPIELVEHCSTVMSQVVQVIVKRLTVEAPRWDALLGFHASAAEEDKSLRELEKYLWVLYGEYQINLRKIEPIFLKRMLRNGCF